MNFDFGSAPAVGTRKRKREPFSTVPFAPDADFIDRLDILERNNANRHEASRSSPYIVQYAHSVHDAVPQTLLFRVHDSTRARFEEAYGCIADRFGLPRRHDPKVDVLRLVSDWLCDETNRQWTMVLDNFDNVGTFFPSRRRKRDKLKALAALPAPKPQWVDLNHFSEQ